MRLDVGVPHRVRTVRLVRTRPENSVVGINFILEIRHPVGKSIRHGRGVGDSARHISPQESYGCAPGGRDLRERRVARRCCGGNRVSEVCLGPLQINCVRSRGAAVDHPLAEVFTQQPIGETCPDMGLREQGAERIRWRCRNDYLRASDGIFRRPSCTLSEVPIVVAVVVGEFATLLLNGNAERTGGSAGKDLAGHSSPRVGGPVQRF